VDVQRRGDPGVAEDAADLGDVESEVDDHVVGEGVVQVVEAHRLEAGPRGGAVERPALEVAMRGGVPLPVAKTESPESVKRVVCR
jgi:hypothetical protein